MLKAMKYLLLAATAATAAAVAAPQASATSLVALTDNALVVINVERARVERRLTSGNIASQLVGIDVRPANRQLYGLFRSGLLATINTRTGTATSGRQLSRALPVEPISIDFNPAVDRLRIISADDTNLRANVDDGIVVSPDDGDINFAGSGSPNPANPFSDPDPSVVGAAYSNSIPGSAVGAVTTSLFDIDASPPALYVQFPPNSGTLVAAARIAGGILPDPFGFDISTDRNGRNRGWIVGDGKLLEIDLAGGMILSSRSVRGLRASEDVRDVAVLPGN
jgi:hypothetical protein